MARDINHHLLRRSLQLKGLIVTIALVKSLHHVIYVPVGSAFPQLVHCRSTLRLLGRSISDAPE